MTPVLSIVPDLGQLFMVGFKGTHPEDNGVKQVLDLAQKKLIGGAIFFKHNLINKEQVKILTSCFKCLNLEYPLLLAIDQEGGRVQRLNNENGFSAYPSAYKIGQTKTIEEAQDIYTQMAQDVHDAGFNLVFGPVVDLHCNASNIIGKFERSFDSDPAQVVTYANAFIKAFNFFNILTCLKHFPGHGLVTGDSHKGLVDITLTHKPYELTTFQALIEQGYDHMIMSAHVMHKKYDLHYPATLSSSLLRPLLNTPFKGPFISDDLMMGAIYDTYPLTFAVPQALKAGIDMVLLSWNEAAAQGNCTLKLNENTLKNHYVLMNSVNESITNGNIDVKTLEASITRLVNLKNKLN